MLYFNIAISTIGYYFQPLSEENEMLLAFLFSILQGKDSSNQREMTIQYPFLKQRSHHTKNITEGSVHLILTKDLPPPPTPTLRNLPSSTYIFPSHQINWLFFTWASDNTKKSKLADLTH